MFLCPFRPFFWGGEGIRGYYGKHQIQPEYGDEQADAGWDCRTRLARPNSQARTRTGKYSFFPVQVTTSRIGNLTRLIYTLAICVTIHTCVPTATRSYRTTVCVLFHFYFFGDIAFSEYFCTIVAFFYMYGECVCCVFFPSILDIKFVGRTSRGHTGGRSHRIFNPAVRALIFVARRIQPFLSLVDREVEFCVLTN